MFKKLKSLFKDDLWGPVVPEKWQQVRSTKGRLANEEDVKTGRAVFFLEGEDISPFMDVPIPSLITYDGKQAIIIQAEESPEGVMIGIRFMNGGNAVVTLNDLPDSIDAPSDQNHSYKILADYHQFYLEDEHLSTNEPIEWTNQATARLLATIPGAIFVGTVENTEVPVEISVIQEEPLDDQDQYDKINECSIDIPSGELLIGGFADLKEDLHQINLSPGMYRARIYYRNLEADSNYSVVLWRDDAKKELEIIK